MKSEWRTEVVQNMTKHKSSVFAQFRLGILPMYIETGGNVNIKDVMTEKFRN